MKWTQKRRASFVRLMRLAKKEKSEKLRRLSEHRSHLMAMPVKKVDEQKARESIYFVRVK